MDYAWRGYRRVSYGCSAPRLPRLPCVLAFLISERRLGFGRRALGACNCSDSSASAAVFAARTAFSGCFRNCLISFAMTQPVRPWSVAELMSPRRC